MSKLSLNEVFVISFKNRKGLEQICLCQKQNNFLYFLSRDIKVIKNLINEDKLIKLCNYTKGAFFYNDKLPVIDNVPFSPKTKVGLNVKMENSEPMVEVKELVKYEKKYNKELLKIFNRTETEELAQ